MIENSADFLPIWMLMSAAFGFMIGDALGDNRRHRKCLEETNEDLRDRLEKDRAGTDPIYMELRQQRGVINDVHKHVVAVFNAVTQPVPGKKA